MPGSSVYIDSIAHVIQIALTPVFLLTGTATLLNVFSTRLGRVADQVDRLSDQGGDREGHGEAKVQLARLRRRTLLLDAAVLAGAMAGVLTCAATLALFFGTLRDANTGNALVVLFGGAVVCTFAALLAFLSEVLLASAGVRRSVEVMTTKTQ
jgi:hypothetical protein